MKVIKLESELKNLLPRADEVLLALGLVTNYGLDFILSNLKEGAKLKILLGVGMCTPFSVMEKLYSLSSSSIKSRIFHKSNSLFHPKFYFFKIQGKYIAIVGSGNCTEGGLSRNTELNYKIDIQDQCLDLKEKWFDIMFKNGHELSEDFLRFYANIENIQEEVNNVNSKINKNVDSFFFKPESATLEQINFESQFFKKEHFQTFTGSKPYLPEADSDRKEVFNRLLELHDQLFLLIQKKGWYIHCHNKNHFISTWEYSVAKAINLYSIESLWLHFGKHGNEIARYKELETERFPQSFIHHIRLQVIIHKDEVGVWLVVGKPNGSSYDRDHIKKQLKNNDFRNEIFSYFSKLSSSYFINVNKEKRIPTDFYDSESLADYLAKDKISEYFIIGRNYKPGDLKISADNIFDTVIEDFGNLMPLYELMKDKESKSR